MIDNTAKIPAVVPDSEVVLENGYPDWEKHLIMAQLRIETATPEGTFQSAVRVLDHFAETGVNGLWINPIQQRDPEHARENGNNGYGNFGVHTIEPTLTGADTIEGSRAVVREFVEQAHKRGIRVIFDTIVWGTDKNAPLFREHPEFYVIPPHEVWGGWEFDWSSQPLREFYTKAAVEFILETGADGFRVDLAPDTSGYFFREVVEACLEKGRKILVMSECSSKHLGAFHIDEGSVGWGPEGYPWDQKERMDVLQAKYANHGRAFLRNNIVDCVKSGHLIGNPEMQAAGQGGTLRYYTFNMICHDDYTPIVCGDRLTLAYQAIFAPFIPIWWIGEEWNNPLNLLHPGVMYFNKIDWDALEKPENRAFFEDVKRYIGLRRDYADVFEVFPDSTRETNIEKVTSVYDKHDNLLQAYARFIPGRAVIIVPNSETEAKTITVMPDYAQIGLAGDGPLTFTDLYSGEAAAPAGRPVTFTVEVRARDVGVYLLDKAE